MASLRVVYLAEETVMTTVTLNLLQPENRTPGEQQVLPIIMKTNEPLPARQLEKPTPGWADKTLTPKVEVRLIQETM